MRPIALCSRVGGLCAVSTLLVGLLGCDYAVRVRGFIAAEPEATRSEVLFLTQPQLSVARPLAGATIEVSDDHQVIYVANSEEDGSFSVGGSVSAQVKQYRVRVTCPGYKSASAPVTYKTYDVEFRLAPLNVPPPLDRVRPPELDEPMDGPPTVPPGEVESLGEVPPGNVTPPVSPPTTPAAPRTSPPTTAPTPAPAPPGAPTGADTPATPTPAPTTPTPTTPAAPVTPAPAAPATPPANPATPGAAAPPPTGGVQTPPAPAANRPGLAPGFYVVARSFRPERGADAAAALLVLQKAGFRAVLLTKTDDLLQVVVTQRFDTAQAAAPLCAKLRALPPQELATGSYDFAQAYAEAMR
jgi:hypothetical protein